MENKILIKTVEEYFANIQGKYANFDYGEHIPTNKLNVIRKLYAPYNGEIEKPLLLIDDTVFRSAKKGILLTNMNLYYRLYAGRKIKGIHVGRVALNFNTSIEIKLGHKGSDLVINGDIVAFTTAFGLGGINEKEGKIINRLFELLAQVLAMTQG